MTLDLNGTAVAQTVPFQSLYQNFRLLTTLSYQEIEQFGGSIGFYPDTSDSSTQIRRIVAMRQIPMLLLFYVVLSMQEQHTIKESMNANEYGI